MTTASLVRNVPGVTIEEVFPAPPPLLLTGVPAFLGVSGAGSVLAAPQRMLNWQQYVERFGVPGADDFFAHAVRGFFENGGLLCYVVRTAPTEGLPDETAIDNGLLSQALRSLEVVDEIDLICAPDLFHYRTASGNATKDFAGQFDILTHCAQLGNRFAVLDVAPTAVEQQMQALSTDPEGRYGALYGPWIKVAGADGLIAVPPSGHVAGLMAQRDRATGVGWAPANLALAGVVDLAASLDPDDLRINRLVALPGGGIAPWGVRTLSHDPAWRYIGVTRLIITLQRWLEQFMTAVVFEANDVRLWVRIMREVAAYLDGLYRQGVLQGRTPDEAYHVRCDAANNPPELRDAGMLVVEIGLAPAAPVEFITLRVEHGPTGLAVTAQSTSEQN